MNINLVKPPILVVSHDSIRGCVRLLVRPSVRPSVSPWVRNHFFRRAETKTANDLYRVSGLVMNEQFSSCQTKARQVFYRSLLG